MFRVPADPANPTFDETTKVSFWQWFTSSKADRKEWQRRRNAGAKLADANRKAQRKERRTTW
jgi:hypothetical protein